MPAGNPSGASMATSFLHRAGLRAQVAPAARAARAAGACGDRSSMQQLRSSGNTSFRMLTPVVVRRQAADAVSLHGVVAAGGIQRQPAPAGIGSREQSGLAGCRAGHSERAPCTLKQEIASMRAGRKAGRQWHPLAKLLPPGVAGAAATWQVRHAGHAVVKAGAPLQQFRQPLLQLRLGDAGQLQRLPSQPLLPLLGAAEMRQRRLQALQGRRRHSHRPHQRGCWRGVDSGNALLALPLSRRTEGMCPVGGTFQRKLTCKHCCMQ